MRYFVPECWQVAVAEQLQQPNQARQRTIHGELAVRANQYDRCESAGLERSRIFGSNGQTGGWHADLPEFQVLWFGPSFGNFRWQGCLPDREPAWFGCETDGSAGDRESGWNRNASLHTGKQHKWDSLPERHLCFDRQGLWKVRKWDLERISCATAQPDLERNFHPEQHGKHLHALSNAVARACQRHQRHPDRVELP